ncbi:unnamed protein product [Heligmosomoides polygyrus]|uniref:Uncharacterized protein n=1 Tax=Heligmosomoides polygyrus TaxID=6339 RepID=A0A183FYS1_HELPZ|nr:unnamed protein product [Heligmosomoides polygyrus]
MGECVSQVNAFNNEKGSVEDWADVKATSNHRRSLGAPANTISPNTAQLITKRRQNNVSLTRQASFFRRCSFALSKVRNDRSEGCVDSQAPRHTHTHTLKWPSPANSQFPMTPTTLP